MFNQQKFSAKLPRNRNVEQIIQICNEAVKEYAQCCFSRAAGKEGNERKLYFCNMLEKLKKYASAQEAFVQIYNFYVSGKQSSRLIQCIEDALMKILDIPNPKHQFTLNGAKFAGKMLLAQEQLKEYASQIIKKSTEGTDTDKNDIPMSTWKSKNKNK